MVFYALQLKLSCITSSSLMQCLYMLFSFWFCVSRWTASLISAQMTKFTKRIFRSIVICGSSTQLLYMIINFCICVSRWTASLISVRMPSTRVLGLIINTACAVFISCIQMAWVQSTLPFLSFVIERFSKGQCSSNVHFQFTERYVYIIVAFF